MQQANQVHIARPVFNAVPRPASHPPAITVLMPHYDCAYYVAEAVSSILSQSFRDLELWVLDDATPNDHWREAIQQFEPDKRLRLFQADRNVGTYRLKKLCIDYIDSPFIGFQDADDVSEPTRLDVQMKIFDKGRYDVLGAGYSIIDEDGNKRGRKLMPKWCNPWIKLGKTNVLHHPSMLVRKGVFETLGSFDGDTTIGADTDFILRAAHRYNVGNVRKELYRYRKHARSLTNASSTGLNSSIRMAYAEKMKQREVVRRQQGQQDLLPTDFDRTFSLHELERQERKTAGD